MLDSLKPHLQRGGGQQGCGGTRVAELVSEVEELVDESLEYKNHGLFSLLTPVYTIGDDVYETLLAQLSVAADGLEFCMGVALQDRVQIERP